MTSPVPYFDALLAEHGDSPRALDWSAQGQRDRFRVLREIGIAPDASVLDVGCGLGHFHWYLAEHGHTGPYIGMDASAAMIERAGASVPPTEPAVFMVGDALHDPLPMADYVVASGVVNVENGSNELDALALLRRCFDACKRGVAVNMLSTAAPSRRADRHYFDPETMLRWARTITPRVTLRHDYRDNDQTVYLYRYGEGNGRTAGL